MAMRTEWLLGVALLAFMLAASSALADGPSDTHSIVFSDGAAEPAIVRLSAGASVEWVNLDHQPHELRIGAPDGTQRVLGTVEPGTSLSMVFDEPGRYQWSSTSEPWLGGEVLVGAVRSPDPGTQPGRTNPAPAAPAAPSVTGDAPATVSDDAAQEEGTPPSAGGLGLVAGGGGTTTSAVILALAVMLVAAASLLRSIANGALTIERPRNRRD